MLVGPVDRQSHAEVGHASHRVVGHQHEEGLETGRGRWSVQWTNPLMLKLVTPHRRSSRQGCRVGDGPRVLVGPVDQPLVVKLVTPHQQSSSTSSGWTPARRGLTSWRRAEGVGRSSGPTPRTEAGLAPPAIIETEMTSRRRAAGAGRSSGPTPRAEAGHASPASIEYIAWFDDLETGRGCWSVQWTNPLVLTLVTPHRRSSTWRRAAGVGRSSGPTPCSEAGHASAAIVEHIEWFGPVDQPLVLKLVTPQLRSSCTSCG